MGIGQAKGAVLPRSVPALTATSSREGLGSSRNTSRSFGSLCPAPRFGSSPQSSITQIIFSAIVLPVGLVLGERTFDVSWPLAIMHRVIRETYRVLWVRRASCIGGVRYPAVQSGRAILLSDLVRKNSSSFSTTDRQSDPNHSGADRTDDLYLLRLHAAV